MKKLFYSFVFLVTVIIFFSFSSQSAFAATACNRTNGDASGCGTGSYSGQYCEAWNGYKSSYGNGYCVAVGSSTVPLVNVYQWNGSKWQFKYTQNGSYNNQCWSPSNCRVACTCSAGSSCSGSGWCENYNKTCNANNVPNFAVYQCANGKWQFKYNQSGSFDNGCYINPNTCPTSNTPTPTNNPTKTPSPSPSAAPGTSVKVVLGFPGIGYSGNVPTHTTRQVTLELYAPGTQNPGGPGTHPVKTATGTVTYDNGSDNDAGYFVSTTPISFTNLPSADYQILVKVQQFLYKLAVNAQNTDNQYVFTLDQNSTTVLTPLLLESGDVSTSNGEFNHLNLNDYNVILSCYGDKANSASCPVKPATQGDFNPADLNDDGKVDIIDLNIWLRSLRDLQQNDAPGCSTGDCQGD